MPIQQYPATEKVLSTRVLEAGTIIKFSTKCERLGNELSNSTQNGITSYKILHKDSYDLQKLFEGYCYCY